MKIEIPSIEELKEKEVIGYIHYKNLENGNHSVTYFKFEEHLNKFKDNLNDKSEIVEVVIL